MHLFVGGDAGDGHDDAYQSGDTVESGGAGLLFLAGPNATQRQRTIVLPPGRTLFTVSDEFGNQICPSAAPCSSFRTPPLSSSENLLFWVAPSAERPLRLKR